MTTPFGVRDLPLSRSHYNVAHNGRTIRAQTRPTATATSSRRVRAEPEVDFQTAAAVGLRGLRVPDNRVLELAADEGRVLVSHDRETMPYHFAEFIASRTSPGLLIVPQHLGVRVTIEQLVMIHSKDVSLKRAAGIAQTVTEWIADPLHPGRQVGWAMSGKHDYEREVRRLIVRWRRLRGLECHAALLSTLTPRRVFDLLGWSPKLLNDPHRVALAYAYLYDQRGGTIEIEFKEDK